MSTRRARLNDATTFEQDTQNLDQSYHLSLVFFVTFSFWLEADWLEVKYDIIRNGDAGTWGLDKCTLNKTQNIRSLICTLKYIPDVVTHGRSL